MIIPQSDVVVKWLSSAKIIQKSRVVVFERERERERLSETDRQRGGETDRENIYKI